MEHAGPSRGSPPSRWTASRLAPSHRLATQRPLPRSIPFARLKLLLASIQRLTLQLVTWLGGLGGWRCPPATQVRDARQASCCWPWTRRAAKRNTSRQHTALIDNKSTTTAVSSHCWPRKKELPLLLVGAVQLSYRMGSVAGGLAGEARLQQHGARELIRGGAAPRKLAQGAVELTCDACGSHGARARGAAELTCGTVPIGG
jgi:hypothetical protein